MKEDQGGKARPLGKDVGELAGCAVVFLPADPPRAGRMALFDPSGTTPTAAIGEPGEITLALPWQQSVRATTVPVRQMPVAAAVPVLTRARHDQRAHPAARFWGAAVLVALHLVARRRLLPGVSPQGFDAWRVGPLSATDVEPIRELAEAMPAYARAVPVEGRSPLELPDAESLVREFLDAVADTMPRTPAAVRAGGASAFAAVEPRRVPELRRWAEEIAAGVDSGVRMSIRLEATDGDLERASIRAVVQVYGLADPALVVDARDLWADDRRSDHEASGPLWHRRAGARARFDIVLAIRRAARVWPPLERLLHVAVPDEIVLADEEVADLLGEAAVRLTAAGVAVHWPRELTRGLTARAVVGTADAPPSDLSAFFGGGRLLSFNWQLALGDQPLTEAEMNRLAEAHRPVVRLRDQWVLVGPDFVRKAKQRELTPLGAIDALGAVLTGAAEVDGERVEVAASGWLDSIRERVTSVGGGSEPIPQPPGLTATLRDYQFRGLRWLARMSSLGLGGCLADDMGLGKTVTLIALHLHRQADPATAGPTLVVCPASLLGNWEREIGRFAPGTAVRRFHGAGRSLDRLLEEVADGFVLTTYATMRLDTGTLAARTPDGEPLWGLVVADEAQHAKNPLSGTAKALRAIPAAARVALTGTPVENNLSELWAILDWTTPGLLGSLGSFRSRWATPVEANHDREAAMRLSRLVGPFLLRRRKSDPGIVPELPQKTETDLPVELTQEQAGLYEAVVRETMDRIRASSGMERRGLVLALLTALKQVCNHPAQYLRESPARLRGRSGKLDLLDELTDTILAEDGAVLVFTQYVTMARLIESHLARRGVGVLLLHGGTPVHRRDEMVRRFQTGEVPVLLLSLKAGGTGLNLARADHVVHYDRWWNPAVEEQATDRAYRIGQTRPVQVHRLITAGTVEDRIAAMLQSKRQLADAVLRSGDAALTELSDAELADLVELRGLR